MSEVTLTITLNGHCSYVSDPDLDGHLEEIATDIERYSKNLISEDWYRKYQVDYESQEAVDLTISVEKRTT